MVRWVWKLSGLANFYTHDDTMSIFANTHDTQFLIYYNLAQIPRHSSKGPWPATLMETADSLCRYPPSLVWEMLGLQGDAHCTC